MTSGKFVVGLFSFFPTFLQQWGGNGIKIFSLTFSLSGVSLSAQQYLIVGMGGNLSLFLFFKIMADPLL